jgi:hypothetical protein
MVFAGAATGVPTDGVAVDDVAADGVGVVGDVVPAGGAGEDDVLPVVDNAGVWWRRAVRGPRVCCGRSNSTGGDDGGGLERRRALCTTRPQGENGGSLGTAGDAAAAAVAESRKG